VKIPSRFLLGAGLALAATAVPSFGNVYDYSYTFGDGTSITGSFDGVPDGLFVDGASNASVQFDGLDMPGSVFISTLDAGFNYDSGAIISYDPEQNDFVFANSDLANGDFSYDSFFLIANTAGEAGAQSFPLGFSGSADFPVVDASWTLKEVPDSGSASALFGLAVFGLAGFRRRLKS
jgi:hypothetical protein